MSDTMTAIAITEFGGPEVLKPVKLPRPTPGEGEILVNVEAAGVNRPDVLQRRGGYPPPPGAPETPGLEIAGTVAERIFPNPEHELKRLELQQALQAAVLERTAEIEKAAAEVVKTEAQGQSWLQRTWRPITMAFWPRPSAARPRASASSRSPATGCFRHPNRARSCRRSMRRAPGCRSPKSSPTRVTMRSCSMSRNCLPSCAAFSTAPARRAGWAPRADR